MTRSKLLKIALFVLAVVLIGLAALYLWLAHWLQAQRESPPALAAGLASPYEQWPTFVRTTFPDGTPEAVMIARLRAEGFNVDPVAHNAFYNWKDALCLGRATVGWSVNEGRVTDVDGEWANVCP